MAILVVVIPVASPFDEYALKVQKDIFQAGFVCDVELDPGTTLNKKIRNAQLDQYNFILVVGEKEKQGNTVNIRTRDNKVHGELAVDAAIERFTRLRQERLLSEENF